MLSIFNFVKSSLIYIKWMTTAVCFTYLASMLNRLIDCCFDDFDETSLFFKKKKHSRIDQLSLKFSVQFEFVQISRNFSKSTDWSYKTFKFDVFLNITELVSMRFNVCVLNCSWIELISKQQMRYQSVFELLNISNSRSKSDKSLNCQFDIDDLLMLWWD